MPVAKVAALLFGSGFCALVYQVVWLRELRLVFGSSTAASAAVLAIFMGGLGLGSAVLGRRADVHRRPLAFYGNLELGIAALAFASPLLIVVARETYIALGGALVLGRPLATLVRLLLSTLILGVTTFLMGGTLPAAARAVETSGDTSRRRVALLYGLNTLGAVTGVVMASFVMLEVYGNRHTLFLACAINALVGVIARVLARRLDAAEGKPAAAATATAPPLSATDGPPVPASLTLMVAGAAGFVFLLMELVWYRMLTPLLGGTTFTFALILASALLGIGLGGAVYGLAGAVVLTTAQRDDRATRPFASVDPSAKGGPGLVALARRRPATLGALSLTLAFEALFMAVPFALGDRVAALAQLLRPLGAFGFEGFAASWSIVTLLVVFPAAFVAGIQFPLLVALLGRGREDVGRHVGLAYAWNTVGSILGSLAGGFGLLPLLSAPGTWTLVVVLLAGLAVVAALLARRLETRVLPVRSAIGVSAVAVLLPIVALGPTAAWRHSPVGAGRIELETYTPNAVREWFHAIRSAITWERDGVESSVAMNTANGIAFVINGKTDGHALGDAGTQVMSGLVAALMHPDPQRAMVIGLGTGSTAGWLAAVPSIERVDVVEIEPAVVEVARACAPVNRDVLDNPKTRLVFLDAREALLTAPDLYDVIFSEPSNPYRAGIASLFTRELYRAAAERLEDDGVFAQWLQAYEVDLLTVQTILATMQSVFAHVEVWRTLPEDLLLVASKQPLRHDAETLRRRLGEEPYRSAMLAAWRSEGLEGLLAHFVAGPELARRLLADEIAEINTDDRNLVEFGFARTLGRPTLLAIEPLVAFAEGLGIDRPAGLEEAVDDWEPVEDARLAFFTYHGRVAPSDPQAPPEREVRAQAHRLYTTNNVEPAALTWLSQTELAAGPVELVLVAHGLARRGDAGAEDWIDRLRSFRPTESDILLARLRLAQDRLEEAAVYLERATTSMRETPWTWERIAIEATVTALEIAKRDLDLAPRMSAALAEPFSVYQIDDQRRLARFAITALHSEEQAARLLEDFEPWVWWTGPFLEQRAKIYAATGHPLATKAQAQLAEHSRYPTTTPDAP